MIVLQGHSVKAGQANPHGCLLVLQDSSPKLGDVGVPPVWDQCIRAVIAARKIRQLRQYAVNSIGINSAHRLLPAFISFYGNCATHSFENLSELGECFTAITHDSPSIFYLVPLVEINLDRQTWAVVHSVNLSSSGTIIEFIGGCLSNPIVNRFSGEVTERYSILVCTFEDRSTPLVV